jgi:hypothetical protein
MHKNTQSLLLALLVSVTSFAARADERPAVFSPADGVLCDHFMCADAQGISRPLTVKYLGASVAEQLFSQGEVDLTAFTYANGVFCDVKERRCHKDRFFTTDGQRSPVSDKYTHLLFGKQ